jgi:hypothetical protein
MSIWQDLQRVDWDGVDIDNQSDGYAPVADGEYQFEIVEAKEEVTNSGYKQMKIQCSIIGPKFAKRRVFHKFFVGHDDHSKRQAVAIGLTQLKGLCSANGINRWPKNDREMVGWKFNAKLDYREYDGKYYDELKFLKKYGPTSGEYGISAGYLAAVELHKSKTIQSATNNYTTSFSDDDVPF